MKEKIENEYRYSHEWIKTYIEIQRYVTRKYRYKKMLDVNFSNYNRWEFKSNEICVAMSHFEQEFNIEIRNYKDERDVTEIKKIIKGTKFKLES